MLSYIVSLYAVCPVPRAQRLEHLFIRAESPQEADTLARGVFFTDAERRRYTILLSRASEMPREQAGQAPIEGPPQMGYLNTQEGHAPVVSEEGRS